MAGFLTDQSEFCPRLENVRMFISRILNPMRCFVVALVGMMRKPCEIMTDDI